MILNNAVINFATVADQTVVSAVAGKQIKVYALNMTPGGTTTVTPKDGATALTGAITIVAGIPFILNASANGDPWFVTSSGNAFVINNSVAVQVSGSCRYEIT